MLRLAFSRTMHDFRRPQFRSACAVASFCLTFYLSGCSYALPAFTPSAAERVRVVAKSPRLLVVHVDVGHRTDYPVPADGRLTVGIPAYRRGCSVYLFNEVKVSNGADPLKTWTMTVDSRGRIIRTLSLRQVSRLATDADGFRLLKVDN